ncbi:hypothetical protein XH88_25735 [Bradyrhizobium sp. CCBAU 51627]|nr:hypothetical protein [Bradyrhizobium sp. CCBAU 51627]
MASTALASSRAFRLSRIFAHSPSCLGWFKVTAATDHTRRPEQVKFVIDAEPSLGSLDRTLDQVRWAMGACSDLEYDDCDREDDDPDEAKQQAPEMCPCA